MGIHGGSPIQPYFCCVDITSGAALCLPRLLGLEDITISCICRGRISSFLLQYQRKLSDDHCPAVLTTLGATPYCSSSVVPPIWNECPVTHGKPAATHMVFTRFKKARFERGQLRPDLSTNANRCIAVQAACAGAKVQSAETGHMRLD
jgi:hypothetical protein